MSRKENYTPEEWDSLLELLAVGVAWLFRFDKDQMPSLSRIIGKMKELKALVEFSVKTRQEYANNELLVDLLQELNSGNRKDSGKSKTLNEDKVIELIRKVNSILEEKSSPNEAGEYRAVVYSAAFAIANASGDGFLGMGARINAKEAEFLAFLKRELLGEA